MEKMQKSTETEKMEKADEGEGVKGKDVKVESKSGKLPVEGNGLGKGETRYIGWC